jgi:hypothetical protein
MPNLDYNLDSLSDGIPHMPRRLAVRERLADHIFFYMQIISWFVFIIGGIVGYMVNNLTGSLILIIGGWLFGIWIRRSLGRRGRDPFHGFYQRLRERANGSRRGVLEWAIENLRGSGFTRTKCQAITALYDEAMKKYVLASSQAEKRAIIVHLDSEVKKISYVR